MDSPDQLQPRSPQPRARTARSRWHLHEAHDPAALLRRWSRAVEGTGFEVMPLAELDGYQLVVIERAGQRREGGLYISAGIHGDEPASPWGLLEWFERGGYASLDPKASVTVFPLLNPAGLTDNSRTDRRGRDLNRLFHRKRTTPFREMRSHLKKRHYDIALCLHEDYDGQGIYAYDLNHDRNDHSVREVLKEIENDAMPVDPRRRIDTRPTENGVIFRRNIRLEKLPGLPEAVYLFIEGHAKRTITFETPSEFSLWDRIDAHVRFLDSMVSKLRDGKR